MQLNKHYDITITPEEFANAIMQLVESKIAEPKFTYLGIRQNGQPDPEHGPQAQKLISYTVIVEEVKKEESITDGSNIVPMK